MSKLTGRKSKKDIFYPETGLPGKTDPPTKDGYVMGGDYIKKSTGEKITGESTGKIKVDEKGVKYVEDIDNPSDTTHLKNIGPIQQKYSSMKSMGQAVAKWTSPNSSLMQKGKPLEKVERRGDEDSLIGQKSDMIKPDFRGEEEYKKEKINKAQKDAAAKKEADKVKKEKRKVKATKTVQTLGSFLADLKPGGTKVKKAGVAADQPKEDKDKDKNKDKDKKVDSGVKNLDNLTKTFTTS